jgi:hypothetical protein
MEGEGFREPASLYILYKKMHQEFSSAGKGGGKSYFNYIMVEESLKICCNENQLIL